MSVQLWSLTVPVVAQVDPAVLEQVCGAGAEANAVCGVFLRATGNALVARVAGAVIPAVWKVLLILVVAYLAHRVMRRIIRRFTRSLAGEGIARLGALRKRAPLADTGPIDLERARLRTETIGGVLRSITSFAIFAMALIMILEALGLDIGPLIAGAGIAGIALGFGAQSLVKDFLSGMFMILEDQFGVGDIIDFGEGTGRVEAVSLRSTRLRDLEGTVWHVPNGEIRRVGNKSQQWARTVVDVGVAYDTDLDHAVSVLQQTADAFAAEDDWRDAVIEPPEVLGLERFDPDQLTIRVVLKVRPASQFMVTRALNARIKRALDAAGIEIPFPQRTVWVRQGEAFGGAAKPGATGSVAPKRKSSRAAKKPPAAEG